MSRSRGAVSTGRSWGQDESRTFRLLPAVESVAVTRRAASTGGRVGQACSCAVMRLTRHSPSRPPLWSVLPRCAMADFTGGRWGHWATNSLRELGLWLDQSLEAGQACDTTLPCPHKPTQTIMLHTPRRIFLNHPRIVLIILKFPCHPPFDMSLRIMLSAT